MVRYRLKIDFSLRARSIAAIAVCLMAFSIASAQTYRFRVYTSSTGLPSNIIYSLFQDSKGYIWFGTDSGVSRYDGVQYLNFSKESGLPDASVRAILEDRSGHIWIATKGGISRFDGETFRKFTTADGLPSNEVLSGILARDGTIWFGTAKGLSRYDGNSFHNFTEKDGIPAGSIWTLLEARSGALLLGIRGGGFVVYSGGVFRAYHVKDGLPDENVFGLAEDGTGSIWIATAYGFCRFDGSQFHRVTKEQGLSSDRGGKVLVDRYNRIWFATFGGGISRLENGKFTVFDRMHGLPDNYLTAIMEDSDGHVWVGTRWNGAFRFNSELFSNYTQSSGLSEGLVSGVSSAADGTVWVASVNEGLSAIRPDGRVERYREKQGLLEDALWSVYADSRGRVWTGGHKGVSAYENGRFRHFSLAEMGARDRISAIFEDKQGRIWFGSNSSTANGIISYDGTTFKRYTVEDGLINNQIESFGVDSEGKLWICAPTGISVFDGNSFTNYTGEHGLPDRRIICFYEDELGRKWIGTSNGLCLFDNNRFRLFTTDEGLASNSIRSIISQGGKLWIGTSNGISSYDGKSFVAYTTRDGLISNTVSVAATARTSNGSVWFGTTDGVVRYTPSNKTFRPNPPRVYISGVRTKDQYFKKDNVSLSYDQHSITVEFVGISLADEDMLRYSFQLKGLDSTWSTPSRERSVRFTLQPGSYTFVVKAVSTAGLESEPKALLIEIAAPFWQRLWFRLTLLLIAAGIGFAIYQSRLRVLMRKQEERLATERRIQEQRVASLRQLLESIRVINSQLDLDTVLQNIAEESAMLVEGDPGGIGLLEGDRVVFKAIWQKGVWEKQKAVFRKGEGIAGLVASTGESIIVNDVSADSRVLFPELIQKYYVNGFIDVPIIDRQGRVVGVLDVRRKPGRPPFGDTERQLLESLAHQAAVAIENADLYGSLAEKNLMIAESLKELEKLYKSEQEVTRTLQELNQMKNNFMAITSHEMRTPLAVLKGYHEMLADGFLGELTDRQKQSIEICNRTIDRMNSTFNNILEMIKCDEKAIHLQMSPVDLAAIIESVLAEQQIFVKHRKQELSLVIPRKLPELLADGEKIRQVLVNLVQNAIKFTPDEGRIEIAVVIEREKLHVTVKDSGIGIESAELERIFDKFYTSRDWLHHTSGQYEYQARGSGLGLSIVRSYVEAHHGRVWAESEGAGKGSCFHVLLPLAPVVGEERHPANSEVTSELC